MAEFQSRMSARVEERERLDNELREFEKMHGYNRDEAEPDYPRLFQLVKS